MNNDTNRFNNIRDKFWLRDCLKTSELSQNNYITDKKIYDIAFASGIEAAQKEIEKLKQVVSIQCEALELLKSGYGIYNNEVSFSFMPDDFMEISKDALKKVDEILNK